MQNTPPKLEDYTDEYIVTSSKFSSKEAFSQYIEKYAFEQDMTLMEAMLRYSDENDIEPEAMARLITPNLKEKIKFEVNGVVEEGLYDD